MYKIAPNRNSRHSIRLFESSDEDEQSQHLNGQTTQLKSGPVSTSPAQAYAQGKAWQHELSGQARFDSVRRQRAADRLRVHNACQKARKVKERALRDVETAAACLVDDVSTSDSYVQIEIDNVEVPIDFVDLTREDTRRKNRKLANKPWPPQKQALAAAELEGWGHDLPANKAYVLITDRE